jgi:hypothetical protein
MTVIHADSQDIISTETDYYTTVTTTQASNNCTVHADYGTEWRWTSDRDDLVIIITPPLNTPTIIEGYPPLSLPKRKRKTHLEKVLRKMGR